MKHKPMSQMNKEKKLKDGVITRATSEPNPPGSPTAADLHALQEAGVDYSLRRRKNDRLYL